VLRYDIYIYMSLGFKRLYFNWILTIVLILRTVTIITK